MNKNDLTVAICLYNCEKYIEETLYTVLNQTYQSFDLLIINDCCTDNSINIIKDFFKKNPRQYELVNFEVNKGLSVGRRYVEENAKTKYILFVDADDCLYPNLVERLYNKITSDSDLMAVGCYFHFIDSNGKKIGGGHFMGDTCKEDFYLTAEKKKLIFMHPTAIVEREMILKAGGRAIDGFPEGKPRYQDLCEDLDVWTRMSDFYAEGRAIVVVPEVLCLYRKHDGGLSASAVGMILRMRHIKSNLLRRRAGGKDQTFIEFYNSVTPSQMRSYERMSDAAAYFRTGIFELRKRNIFKAIYYVGHSIMLKPSYILQKIKNNLIK